MWRSEENNNYGDNMNCSKIVRGFIWSIIIVTDIMDCMSAM